MERCTPLSVVKLLLALLLLSASLPMAAQENTVAQEFDEDFVIASLLISEPGGALYSRLGHAALHMQCPQHGLDYVFTYEAEDASSKILRFFAGKLKMGMMALPPEMYLESFRTEGRGVREFRLNLPIEAKRNLWRVLDDRLMEGIDLPYDYLHRGCAYSSLKLLKEGVKPLEMEFGPWPEEYGQTRREIGHEALASSKWVRCFLHLISGGEIDRQCRNENKVITPEQLRVVLSSATVNGVPVISSEPVTIVEGRAKAAGGWPSPLFISAVLLAATLLCGLLRWRFMDYLLLAVQTALGLITVYLVFFSSLVCTEWSWLLIPFNPLPLIFWRWRSRWALPYAAVLLLWSAFMLLWPHLLTDPAYVVVAVCLFANYVAMFYRLRRKELSI